VGERLKPPVLKTGVHYVHRGFESRPLRQIPFRTGAPTLQAGAAAVFKFCGIPNKETVVLGEAVTLYSPEWLALVQLLAAVGQVGKTAGATRQRFQLEKNASQAGIEEVGAWMSFLFLGEVCR
jgi:hypothetical protein